MRGRDGERSELGTNRRKTRNGATGRLMANNNLLIRRDNPYPLGDVPLVRYPPQTHKLGIKIFLAALAF
jgi:hypothetical protein